MSSMTLPTRGLVGLLEDVVLTTLDKKMEVPHLSAVLLHTARGPWQIPVEDAEDDGGEPLFDEVTSDLLIGSTTCLSMIGQGHTACTGSLHRPVLISRLDADAVIDVFKPLVSGRLPKTVTHQTVLTLSAGSLIVSEDPTQVPGGVSVSLAVMDLDPFPRNIGELLAPDPTAKVVIDKQEVPSSYGTGLDGDHLNVLAKVARRRKMPIAFYRSHQRHRIVVTIGQAYRAVLVSIPLKEDDSQHTGPLVEVFTPDLPARSKDAETKPLVSA